MVRVTTSEELEKGSMGKEKKTKSRFLHTRLIHAATVDNTLQSNPGLTDLKWKGLSWSMVTR